MPIYTISVIDLHEEVWPLLLEQLLSVLYFPFPSLLNPAFASVCREVEGWNTESMLLELLAKVHFRPSFNVNVKQ